MYYIEGSEEYYYVCSNDEQGRGCGNSCWSSEYDAIIICPRCDKGVMCYNNTYRMYYTEDDED